MFRLTEPSSSQIQNIVLVHSVSAYIIGSHTVYRVILTLMIMFYSVIRYIITYKTLMFKIYIKTPISMSLLNNARLHMYCQYNKHFSDGVVYGCSYYLHSFVIFKLQRFTSTINPFSGLFLIRAYLSNIVQRQK